MRILKKKMHLLLESIAVDAFILSLWRIAPHTGVSKGTQSLWQGF